MERQRYQELSRYYPLGQGQKAWTRSLLLSKGKQSTITQALTTSNSPKFLVLEDLESLPEPSYESLH